MLRIGCALGLVVLCGCGDDDSLSDAGMRDAAAADVSAEDAGEDAADDGGADGGVESSPDCDPLNPAVCMLPYPSTFYEEVDATTESGRRLRYVEQALPGLKRNGRRPRGEVIERIDGWSPSVGPLAHLKGATVTGLPRVSSIETSTTATSASILLDAATGELVPHFVDIDVTTDNDDERLLILRPVVPLGFGRRYIVAYRGVVDREGAPVPAPPAFAALRDEGDHPHPSIDARRELYADIFAILERAGISRGTLQLAWDFHTRSEHNATATLLHVRDHALELVGAEGPAFRITADRRDVSEYVARRIEGMMEVPLYLEEPGAGSVLMLGPDGMPVQNGTAEYPFLVLIPPSATAATPAALTQFGHGLFGTRDQVEGHARFGAGFNHVLFAVDWIGMSNEDYAMVGELVIEGAGERFQSVPDRLHQAFVNALLAMRMMAGRFASEVLTDGDAPIVDVAQRYYFGESQGGIFGGTYMAVSTDVVRGGLRVPGQPYSLLLARSVDFDPYFGFLRLAYRDGADIQLMVALGQLLWDTVEPGTWTRFIRAPLGDTPAHEVLMHAAIGDHQVSTFGAHIMARAIGAPLALPNARPVPALIEGRMLPITGSALVEFDFGLPPEPIENEPLREGDDPHGKVKQLLAAQAQLDRFFRTGVVEAFCDGPCDPE